MDIQKIHEDVFTFLYDYHFKEKEKGSQFHFTLRKTNRYSRLDKGYWFHGNDGYVAFSFWSGFDYANKTPNICYQIFSEKESRLVLVARDSERKSRFIDEKLLPLYSEYSEKGYSRYSIVIKGSYLDALRNFIEMEKPRIDSVLKENKNFFEVINEREAISNISAADFNFNLRRTLKWRAKKEESEQVEAQKGPFLSIERLDIKSYGPIRDLIINLENEKPQFIFLTGENGGGKSSILRAITMAITGNQEYVQFGNFQVEIALRRGKAKRKRIVLDKRQNPKPKYLYREFAAYGPHRLVLQSNDSSRGERKDACYSIFNDDGVLLDIWEEMGDYVERRNSRKIRRRLDTIREALHDLNENLKAIHFPGESENSQTLFVEQDHSGQSFPPVTFDQLASGIRSITAMFGDMMTRLFYQQPKSEDIAQLKGIVLIDEIDLHLHPKLQKLLIEQLAATFENVQFVMSTHSPIPFLGAPKNSVIFRVSRDVEMGVSVDRLDDVPFGKLLPNTILTSPIFGMSDILPVSRVSHEEVRTEDSWREFKLNEEVKSELDKIYTRLRNDEEN